MVVFGVVEVVVVVVIVVDGVFDWDFVEWCVFIGDGVVGVVED